MEANGLKAVSMARSPRRRDMPCSSTVCKSLGAPVRYLQPPAPSASYSAHMGVAGRSGLRRRRRQRMNWHLCVL